MKSTDMSNRITLFGFQDSPILTPFYSIIAPFVQSRRDFARGRENSTKTKQNMTVAAVDTEKPVGAYLTGSGWRMSLSAQGWHRYRPTLIWW